MQDILISKIENITYEDFEFYLNNVDKDAFSNKFNEINKLLNEIIEYNRFDLLDIFLDKGIEYNNHDLFNFFLKIDKKSFEYFKKMYKKEEDHDKNIQFFIASISHNNNLYSNYIYNTVIKNIEINDYYKNEIIEILMSMENFYILNLFLKDFKIKDNDIINDYINMENCRNIYNVLLENNQDIEYIFKDRSYSSSLKSLDITLINIGIMKISNIDVLDQKEFIKERIKTIKKIENIMKNFKNPYNLLKHLRRLKNEVIEISKNLELDNNISI